MGRNMIALRKAVVVLDMVLLIMTASWILFGMSKAGRGERSKHVGIQ